jgi:hypothetical protein
MNTKLEVLTAKVAAVNKANKYATALYPQLVEIFTPFVGQKILKADGSLLSKFQNLIPTSPLEPLVWRSNASLQWNVKVCEFMPPSSCVYHTSYIYVGTVERSFLTEIFPHPFTGRSDYTVEEILQHRAEYESAKKLADELRGNLSVFGE